MVSVSASYCLVGMSWERKIIISWCSIHSFIVLIILSLLLCEQGCLFPVGCHMLMWFLLLISKCTGWQNTWYRGFQDGYLAVNGYCVGTKVSYELQVQELYQAVSVTPTLHWFHSCLGAFYGMGIYCPFVHPAYFVDLVARNNQSSASSNREH